MVTEDLNAIKDDNEENPQLSTTAGAKSPTGTRTATNSSGLPSTQGSGRFQNLQKYIQANQGAGQQMASKLSNATNQDISSFNQGFGAKTKEVGEGVSQARNLFDTQGEAYKSQLGAYQQGLNTFKDMADRDQFDTTAADITAFTKSPQFGQFQTLQQGLGLNEDQLQQAQGLARQLQQDTLTNLGNKYQDIQTEQGRYNLLQQATPTFGQKATAGGNRLNQLFFQQDPNAVSNLQNTFKTQMDAIRGKESDLAALDTGLAEVSAQELALQNALQQGATGLQDTFYNKLNQQQNFDQVNQARSDLYNDYVNQIRTGQYTQDLADMLGLTGLSTYQPVGDRFTEGNVITKPGQIGNIGSPQVGQNQFRQYTVGSNPADAANYLTKSQMTANTFQDLLRDEDFANYQALRQLSNDQNAALAQGASTLDSAVRKSDINDIVADIRNRDQNFLDNYAGRNYAMYGIGQEVYDGKGANQQTSDVRGVTQTNDPLADYNAFQQRALSYSNNPSDYGTLTLNQALANMDDYVLRGNNAITNANRLIFDRGNNNDVAKAQGRATAASFDPLASYLANLVSTTGVNNISTIDPTANLTQTDRYKKLKGLL